jgi:opacity protein-like surface antigen
MKKLLAALILSTVVASPVFAAEKSTSSAGSVGVNAGFNGVFGVQGEFSLASSIKQPISLQIFWKNWSAYNTQWNVSGFGAAGIYDFSSIAKLDRRVHPYAGAGLIVVQNSWRGTGGTVGSNPVGSGLYLTGGVRYDLTPQLDIDGNLNTFGGLTVGLNLKF